MKSYWIKAQDGGTAVELRDVPMPTPNAGEMIVRMRATSLNRGELLAAIGLHALTEPKLLGSDVSGEVHAVGEGVKGFKPGDRVVGRGRGACSEYARLPVHQAALMPDKLTFEQAGAVPTAFVTAYEILFPWGKLKAGESLLVVGASSGVGVACVQIGKVLGCRVIGTSGSADKLAKLKSLGLDVGLQARGGGFAAKAIEATGGKGVNLAVDLVGGTAFADALRALSNQGRMAIVGYVDKTLTAEIDLEAVHGKRLQIFGVSNAHLTQGERAEAWKGFAVEVLPALADGRIVPVIDKVFSFADLPAAKAYVDSNSQLGKVVVRHDA
ncbi:MAG TPA: zinc-binding dehydrogenase [Opitutaceae bacterium]|nr:zinc-binding dehydrogenase [Opitutaceae bacterium]